MTCLSLQAAVGHGAPRVWMPGPGAGHGENMETHGEGETFNVPMGSKNDECHMFNSVRYNSINKEYRI